MMQVSLALRFLMRKMKSFINYLNSIDCRFIEKALISEYITFRVGGPCAVMCFPDSESKIESVIKHLKDNDIKYFVIGRGSNLLSADNGFEGVIVNTVDFEGIELIDESTIKCKSGTSLMKVCRFAYENSLSGLEFAFGIPGTVGGAVYMNAGAYGGEIKDVLVSSDYISNSGIVSAEADDLDLSYRHSFFSDKDYIITSAVFRLIKGDKSEIKAKMDDLIGRRKDKQPIEYPSAGSTFKRPEGYFAGALIQECGLKGKSVGGAQVSEKHAGFVINKDKATCDDILNLIHLCQDTVLNEKGVKLETEVKFIK